MIVQIPQRSDSRHAAWAKHVTAVDETKDTGYAFLGRFLEMGAKADLPVGAVVLVYDGRGSVKRWNACVSIYRVDAAGLMRVGGETQVPYGRMWALEVRDAVAALVNRKEA